MFTTLELVLLLLAAAVAVVGAFRYANLPPVLGYLLVGATIGPHAINLVPDSEGARYLAEFGVVFLMFSIGLEFSLPRLYAMKRIVFGLGLAQVLTTIAISIVLALALGFSWRAGVALGGILAMSSTAILSKLLTDRMQLDSAHGREIMGVLLFQDLAVVPLLILIPSLSQPAGQLAGTIGIALAKAVAVLVLVLFLGQRLMGAWFYIVARRRSAELFMLNILLITLGLAYLTESAGLSLALGAFLAGMLISETEYRYQVEEDIKPFRDVLLGLFFVTVGTFLDLDVIVRNLPAVLGLLALILAGKLAVISLLSRAFGAGPGTALRTGLWLCAGGEFGFVLVAQMNSLDEISPRALQVTVAALVLSMLLAPMIVQYADKLVLRFVKSEWLLRSMELTRVAAQSMNTEKHAIICGYGRTGQYMARLLALEGVTYVALDLDPERVREAAAAGETVVYGDSWRRETLIAAGIMRASVAVVSFGDAEAAMKVLSQIGRLRPDLPVVVRARDERHIERLASAGAVEVVPEMFEASMMMAWHALVLLGVPVNRVMKRIRLLRNERYALLRGFFPGASDVVDITADAQDPRLHSLMLNAGAYAIGQSIGELNLDQFHVSVTAVRRRGIRGLSPGPETRFEMGDVIVLLGRQEELLAAEMRLLKGGW
ncbi:MAG: cation:proton antiporter [Rhodocyclaceae bacterium]